MRENVNVSVNMLAQIYTSVSLKLYEGHTELLVTKIAAEDGEKAVELDATAFKVLEELLNEPDKDSLWPGRVLQAIGEIYTAYAEDNLGPISLHFQ
jgi:23S rRNA A2030 N6-methylase RlmJ